MNTEQAIKWIEILKYQNAKGIILQGNSELRQGTKCVDMAYETALSALHAQQERDGRCGCPCGELDPNFCETCKRIRIEAIKEKLARENPKPLTLEEMKERFGKPIWVVPNDEEHQEPPFWAICGEEWETRSGIYLYDIISDDGGAYDLYGKTWLAYDHEPKEATMRLVDTVKHGEWKRVNGTDADWKCSVCNEEIGLTDHAATPQKAEIHYCPNCGANMREVKK